jgi:hypothetical protein
MRNSEPVSRLRPVRAVLCDCIATARRGLRALPFAFPFRGKAPQWGLVFTLMTLELGLVPFPLYARNR